MAEHRLGGSAGAVSESQRKPSRTAGATAMLVQPWTRRMVLAVFWSVCFADHFVISLLFPSAAPYLYELGYSSLFIGAVYSIYPLMFLAFSPIANHTVERVGRKIPLIGGLLLVGTFTVVFGYAAELSGGARWLQTLYFLGSRALAGAGAAFITVAAYSMVGAWFPDLTGVQSVNVVLFTLAYILAPIFGALMFSAFGFGLQYLVIGAVILMLIPLAIATETSHPAERIKHTTTDKVEVPLNFIQRMQRISSLRLHLLAGFLVLATISSGVYQPELVVHLMVDAGVTQVQAGLMIAVYYMGFCLGAVLAGWYLKRTSSHYGLTAGGAVGLSLYLMTFGLPGYRVLADGLGVSISTVILYRDWALMWLGGVAIALVYIPLLPGMMKFNPHPDTSGIQAVATIFTSCEKLGCVLGPLLGAGLINVVGYSCAQMIVGVTLFTYSSACILHGFVWTSPEPPQPSPALLTDAKSATDAYSELANNHGFGFARGRQAHSDVEQPGLLADSFVPTKQPLPLSHPVAVPPLQVM